MLKKVFFGFCLILIILLGLGVSYLSFFKSSEKRYSKIICYYVARSLTDDSDNFNGKIASIRSFVHENVLPIHAYPNKLDVLALEKLLSGIGWCDQQARVFMQLARSIGVTTRLLFLRAESGASPHSIAEALAPDGRWVIVDVGNNLDLINKKGKPATQTDIKEDLGIITENDRVKAYAKSQKLWHDPAYISMYYNPPAYVVVKEGSRVDFLKFVPRSILKPIVAIITYKYLERIKPDIKNDYEFKMIKARILELLEYFDKSEALYADIIENSEDLLLVRRAEYYRALLLYGRKRYEEAYNFITNVLAKDENNPYSMYLYSLRARVLKGMGRPKEAGEDLKKIEYSLDA